MNVSVRLERLLPGFAPFARVWIIFACASFTVLVTADLFRLEGVRIGPHAVIGRDFVNVWIGGKLAWINQPSIVYDIYAGCVHQVLQIGGHGAGHAALRSSVFFCSRSSSILR